MNGMKGQQVWSKFSHFFQICKKQGSFSLKMGCCLVLSSRYKFSHFLKA